MTNRGEDMHRLARELWPLPRSITGHGVQSTLAIIHRELGDLNIVNVPTGSKILDWTVPQEWWVNEAWIKTPDGQKICDFNTHNLHLLNSSIGIHKYMPLAELSNHLHSLPDQPDAIPYRTSYFAPRWGFCIQHSLRETLVEGQYEVFIDAGHKPGHLTYGELLIEGNHEEEVFISTYICHPSMANNELSGPVVTSELVKWLLSLPERHYSYRIVFVPETIGAIAYLANNLENLKAKVVAGFNLTCVGDERTFSFMPSRVGTTISDVVGQHVLKHLCSSFDKYGWRDRGSDERQYCAPGVDLPVVSIMRSKYGTFPEYHTSLDDLDNLVTAEGLEGGFEANRLALEILERNVTPVSNVIGEPFMSKRNLRSTLGGDNHNKGDFKLVSDLISMSDGRKSLLDIAESLDIPVWDLYEPLDRLIDIDLISLVKLV